MKKTIIILLLSAICLFTFFSCDTSDNSPTDISNVSPDDGGGDQGEESTDTSDDTKDSDDTENTEDKEDKGNKEDKEDTGNTEDDPDMTKKSIKILAIGNSFSIDGMEFLPGIFRNAGYEEVILGNLYIGSCTLDIHWNNLQYNSPSYVYYKNTDGSWGQTPNFTLKQALGEEDWDIITVQQGSGSSGMKNTFGNLHSLVESVSRSNPNADIYWHMTWSYQANSTHNEFYKYSNDQMTMYNAIVDAVNEKVLTEPLIKGVIPCGTTVQNLRTSYIGDNMTKDGFHLTVDKGRYAAGLTWYATLTGNSIDKIDWYPEAFEYIRLDGDVIKEAVNNALKSPYSVTESKFKTYTQPSDEQYIKMLGNGGEYTLLEWENLGNGYYYSIDGIGLKTNNGTSDNYIASEIFTKEDLPNGSIIILDEGYEYRPEGWRNESSKNTSRPEKVSSSAVAVNEKWWGDFTLRGFNLSYKGAKVSVSPEIAEHLRIYVPAK